MTEPKRREHKLAYKHPILCTILLVILGVALFPALSQILNMPLVTAFPAYPREDGPVGVLLTGFLVLFLYKLCFRPDFEGSVKHGEYSIVLPLLAAHAVYLIWGVIHCAIQGKWLQVPNMQRVLVSLSAGVLEECAFRASPSRS